MTPVLSYSFNSSHGSATMYVHGMQLFNEHAHIAQRNMIGQTLITPEIKSQQLNSLDNDLFC